MKNLDDLKIVACLMGHDDDDYIDLVLKDLSQYTNQIYVNLNEATDKIKSSVKDHPNVVKWIETKNRGTWDQGKVRDDTIRMLDEVKPDIVLFPDSDEIFPKNLKEQLVDFWKSDCRTFWFRLLYLWGDDKHFRNDGIWRRIHHARAMKWEKDITYLPKYAGYACPTNLLNEKRYHSNSPIIHYGYLSEENRTRKFIRGKKDYCNEEYKNQVDKNQIIIKVPKELLQ